MKFVTTMLRKNNDIKWTAEEKKYFEDIKKALTEASVLVSQNYLKDFLVSSFSSEDIIVAVLLQKNDEDYEQPVTFFSKSLRDANLKYNIMEKQAYALVKALKYFKTYVLHSKVIAYVPNIAIKDILTQLEIDGKSGKWVLKILECDL